MAADLITCGHLYEELNKKQGFKTMVLRQYTRQEEFEDLGFRLLLLAVVSLLKENKFKYSPPQILI